MNVEQPLWSFLITVFVSSAGVVAALFATRLQLRKYKMDLRTFTGSGPHSTLTLELDAESSPAGLCGTGWIENPLTDVADDEEDSSVAMHLRSRIPAYFVRARVRNNGPFTAKDITLCLTKIESTTDPSQDTVHTVQPLRWSDTWAFRADAARKAVIPSDGILTFPTLPAKSYRFCDVCFHYDLEGPPRLGRLKSRRVYFTVRNLPSQTFSIPSGEYKISFHLAADNCEPVEQNFRLHVHIDELTKPALRVRFERE